MTATLEPTRLSYPHPLLRCIAATRPAFLSASLVAVLLGLAASGPRLDVPLALATLALALLAHAGTNVLNDYYDALNGTDARNIRRLYPYTGGSRFIQNGLLSHTETASLGYALMLATMLGGLWLVLHSGKGLIALGAAGLFIGWAYSAAPLRLNGRGLGEPCVFLGMLGITLGAYYVQHASFAVAPLVVGVPYALLTTNLLFINQFPDTEADAAAGKRHWVVRLGPRRARAVYPAVAALAALWLLLAIWRQQLPTTALLALLPFALSIGAARLLNRHYNHPAALRPAIERTIAAMLGHGALLAAILFWENA
jgi:1,4-dihydroxy-2-naphthoate octaprenyltransferase